MNATDVLHDNKDNICLTSYCMDCIHHEYFRYQEDHFTHEHCQIWGKDGCHSMCNDKETKRNIDGRMKIGGTKIFTSRVWGRHVPTRSCPGWAENFQELKICGHGTILTLLSPLQL